MSEGTQRASDSVKQETKRLQVTVENSSHACFCVSFSQGTISTIFL